MTGFFKINKIDNNRIIVKMEGDFDCDESIALSFELSCLVQNMNNVYILYDISNVNSISEGAKGIIGTIFIQNSPYIESEAYYAQTQDQQKLFNSIINMTGKENFMFIPTENGTKSFLGII